MNRFPNVERLARLGHSADVVPPASVVLLRMALIAGAVAAIVVVSVVASGVPEPADRDLIRLLRGMAAIKGLLALGAAVAVGWRLGRPIAWPVAGAYLIGAWMLFVAVVLIWHVAFVPAAALLFHAAGLGVLVLSMHEGIGPSPRWRWEGRRVKQWLMLRASARVDGLPDGKYSGQPEMQVGSKLLADGQVVP